MTETKEWSGLVDKSAWERGEWDQEIDKRQWADEATGLDCLINRNRFGVWCGYVGVPEGHPLYGKSYQEVDELAPELRVHGGLTYSNGRRGEICHEAEREVWWLGFDCGHLFDKNPGLDATLAEVNAGMTRPKIIDAELADTYRNRAYVEAQCRALAAQIKELENAVQG
jgi:hypothetical protein